MPTGPKRRYDPMIDQIDDLLHYQNVVERAFPVSSGESSPRTAHTAPLSHIRVGRVARQRGDEFIRGISIRDPGGRVAALAPKTTILGVHSPFTVYDRGTAAHLARPAGEYRRSPSRGQEQDMRKRIRIRDGGLGTGVSDLYGARPGTAEPRERTLISRSHSAPNVTYGVNPFHFNKEGRPAGEVRKGTPSQRRDRERHG